MKNLETALYKSFLHFRNRKKFLVYNGILYFAFSGNYRSCKRCMTWILISGASKSNCPFSSSEIIHFNLNLALSRQLYKWIIQILLKRWKSANTVVQQALKLLLVLKWIYLCYNFLLVFLFCNYLDLGQKRLMFA